MPDLSRLGLGTAPIGNLYRAMSDAEAEATVHAALDAGIRYFDTAPHYGFGLAEERLGSALAGRTDVRVSTKVGRLLVPTDDPTPERHGFVGARACEPVFDYSGDAVLRSHDASLRRLRRDRVDVLLAHDLGRLTHGDAHDAMLRDFLDGGYPAMRRLRDEGTVDAIGIGVNEVAVCLDLLERVEIDTILLAGRYTLLDRSAAVRLLPLCAERGVRVIVGGPYNSGILAQSFTTSAERRFNYEPADVGIVAEAQALEAECALFGVALPEAALQFPLRHPAVDRVIAGMANPAEVADNVARIAVPVPDALWQTLETVPA
ncbi:aldo/keto reductase [Sphingomonas nostoxanthinifaciens]|uniref:aldo/keto reductase n=1 Tax=Sphingomonas nostoxanthinifaciens TaxID=2872652 RepID=UPI001CC214BA|nr:aldo/keto reductase [Sphingomonas nostoxanthinifaciens]UAK23053.1 aldo/keto reductase [Sphingomonas nostoxanthinifaciens]